MSALLAPTRTPDAPGRRRPALRSVAPPPRRLARLPFLVVMIGVFGVGMAGLLMLNTTLQNQAFEARTLNRQATELTYVQSDLENQVDVAAAPQQLASRASQLGLRPNPYPAFLVLPGGKVVGKATPVKGSEMPGLVIKTPEQLQAEEAAAVARKAAEQSAADAAAKAEAEAAKAEAAAQQARAKADAAKKAADKKAADKKKGN